MSQSLADVARAMVAPGKGILAADESSTAGARRARSSPVPSAESGPPRRARASRSRSGSCATWSRWSRRRCGSSSPAWSRSRSCSPARAGLTLLRNRRLARQRRELLGRSGCSRPRCCPRCRDGSARSRASVAYRPAEGPGAGGDFYDVFPLAGGKTAVVIGDVSGHGRDALGRTALSRYTLRAYIEAGLEPREALQIAGSVLAGKLEGDFITALIAIHDAGAGTLTYSTAGHPPPIVVSSARFVPVLAATRAAARRGRRAPASGRRRFRSRAARWRASTPTGCPRPAASGRAARRRAASSGSCASSARDVDGGAGDRRRRPRRPRTIADDAAVCVIAPRRAWRSCAHAWSGSR